MLLTVLILLVLFLLTALIGALFRFKMLPKLEQDELLKPMTVPPKVTLYMKRTAAILLLGFAVMGVAPYVAPVFHFVAPLFEHKDTVDYDRLYKLGQDVTKGWTSDYAVISTKKMTSEEINTIIKIMLDCSYEVDVSATLPMDMNHQFLFFKHINGPYK